MHAVLTTGQVARWYQLWNQVTLGEQRADLRHAQLVAHVRAANGIKDQSAADYVLPFYPVATDSLSPIEKIRGHLAAHRDAAR